MIVVVVMCVVAMIVIMVMVVMDVIVVVIMVVFPLGKRILERLPAVGAAGEFSIGQQTGIEPALPVVPIERHADQHEFLTPVADRLAAFGIG